MKIRNGHGIAVFGIGLTAGVALGALEVTRMTIDGGGAMRSTGATFELSGTIGQPDAGVLVSGSLTLSGGFWFTTPAGDVNQDGVTGLADVAALPACLSGPGGQPPPAECRSFDVDRSGQVDLVDFAVMQSVFGG
jgi:hypothetical protein